MKTQAMARLRTVAGMLAVAALAVGCTSTGGGSAPAGSTSEQSPEVSYETRMIGADGGGEPVAGGSLTYGALSEPQVLDPAAAVVAGSTGGMALAAVYDVLMRWDPASGEVVPQLAESLEPNEDHTTWTLTLRDGVSFSDGTPLDAQAVLWSLQRYVEEGGGNTEVWRRNVAAVHAPDARTVVFELTNPWPSFDFLLTIGPGMIVAKSAVAGESFTPVGAGPFTFVRHAPQEELVLEANENYWDGRPPLDGIRVVFLANPEATWDSLNGGSIDAAFVSQPDLVEQALVAGRPGFLSSTGIGGGGVAVINAAEGHPGSDPRVRKAMQLAIDPKVMRERTYGAGVASTAIYPEYSRWHTGVESLPYDPEQARKLLEQAKADGFDGVVTFTESNDPMSRSAALVVKASLEAVGFTVELDLVRSIADQVRKVLVDGDYDVAGWGLNWRAAAPFPRMFATLHSQGNSTAGMATSPEMDALLEQFRSAASEAERQEIMGKIQELWNDLVPALVWAPGAEFVVRSDAVHGMKGTSNSMVLVDDAWVTPAG